MPVLKYYADRGGRRNGFGRRQVSAEEYLPERRGGNDRRSGRDRRCGEDRRKSVTKVVNDRRETADRREIPPS